MASAAVPEMIAFSQVGKSQNSINRMDADVYIVIIASSMKMSTVLFFLHLYGSNFATKANVNVMLLDHRA